MGTIRERRPGHFELRAYIGRSPRGSPRYLQETFVSKRRDTGIQEAKRRLKDLEKRAAAKRVETTTFGALLDDWLAHSERIGRSPTTVHGYRVKVKAIRGALGSIQLDVLSAKDLDRWYGELRAAGTTPAMVRHYHRLISAALQTGVRWDAVSTNVAQRASPPRVPKFEIQPPSGAEVAELVQLARASRTPVMASVIMWAALTGMRRGEICGLRWTDVDGDSVSIGRSVYQLGHQAPGEKDTKTHQRRELVVDKLAQAVLKARHEGAVAEAAAIGEDLLPNGFVWSTDPCGAQPMRPDRITLAFGRLCDRAHFDYRFHDLRHFAATTLLAGGVDVVTAARWLGHERPSTTTDIYGHVLEQSTRHAAQVLGKALASKAL